MRKERQVSNTIKEYYCDICGEQQHGGSCRGEPRYASDELRECNLCGAQVCCKCRKKVPAISAFDEIVLCTKCFNHNENGIEKIRINIEEFEVKDKKLRLALKRDKWIYLVQ